MHCSLLNLFFNSSQRCKEDSQIVDKGEMYIWEIDWDGTPTRISSFDNSAADNGTRAKAGSVVGLRVGVSISNYHHLPHHSP